MAVASGGYCEGIDLPVDGLRPTHPWFGSNRAHPVSEARDEAQILADMLFTDQSDGHDAAGRQRDRHPEEALEHENAFGVMPERPVAEVRYDRLRFVEPLMEREIVVRRPAPAARRGKRMVLTMSHHRLIKRSEEHTSELQSLMRT